VRTVVVVCPQERDRQLIAAAGPDRDYEVRYVGDDLDRLDHVDAEALLDECLAGPGDAVVGTKDRSALLAAIVAERRGLPGPSPRALVALQHKPRAREIEHAVVPEATPASFVVDGRTPPFSPPYFVKPAVGRLSQGARRVDDLEALEASADTYAEGYGRLAALAGFDAGGFGGQVAEELLTGREVTLEGYVHSGRVKTIGITDSLKYPGTNSFEAFAYPTELPGERQDELRAVATRLLPAFGFDAGFFNIEFFVPDDGPARLIEVNGRIASQFAPLIQATHGRSTYELLFALASGDDPEWDAHAPHGAAISYVLRRFDDALVETVPEPAEGLEVLVGPGARLAEQGAANDVASFRLAIVYEWGETREEALQRARERAAALSFRLAPAAPR